MSILSKKNIEFTGQKRSALDMARGRVALLSLFFIVVYIIVGAKVIDLTLIQGVLQKGEDKVQLLEAKSEPKVVPIEQPKSRVEKAQTEQKNAKVGLMSLIVLVILLVLAGLFFFGQ